HQDAGAHALQDQRVQRLQIGHFFGSLPGQALAALKAAAQPLNHHGSAKAQGAQSHRLGALTAGGGSAQGQAEGEIDQADGSNGSDEKTDAAMQQDVGDGDRDDQQVADPAGSAACKIEQRRE